MPLFLFCIGHADGALKTPQALRASYGKNWRMPRPLWLQNLLQQHGAGEALLQGLVRNERRIGASLPENESERCFLLIRVEPGECHRGSLTPWTQESLLLFRHLFQPWDAFSLQIHGRVLVNDPLLPEEELYASVRKKSLLFALKQVLGTTSFRSFTRCSPGTHRQDLTPAQAAHELGIRADEWNLVGSQLCCLWVSEPLLHLMKRGAWKTVMCQARWLEGWRNKPLNQLFGRTLSFPAADWVDSLRDRDLLWAHIDIAQTPSTLAPGAAATVAHLLRSYSPNLLAELPEHEKEEAELNMSAVVAHLDHLSGVIMPVTRLRVHEPLKVVRGMLAALSVRNVSELGSTVINGLLAACPQLSRQSIEHLLGTLRLPSAATLSKRQVQLDAALCAHWRNTFARESHAIYLWADSSPQAGEDYLLSLLLAVPREQLLNCMDACHVLWRSVEQLEASALAGDKDTLTQTAVQRHQASATLQHQLHLHRQVPCALGHGASSLDFKTRLLCHKFLVEAASPKHAIELMNAVCGICVDLGVEAGLADVFGTPEKYLESWHCAPREDDDMQSDGESASLQRTAVAMQKTALDGLAAHDEHVFSKALLSPGMLHVMDTITTNLCDALPSFPEWILQLKALAKLLGTKHLRQRYLQKCFVGRNAHFLVLFKKKFPKIAPWRWGTMHRVLSMLLPLQTALQHTWNAEAFTGEGPVQQRSADSDHLDTQCITKAVTSNMFWSYAHMVKTLHDWAQQVTKWSEACPCHGWMLESGLDVPDAAPFQGSPEARSLCMRTLSRENDGPAHTCVLAGKRAVGLATGELDIFMKKLRDLLTVHLLPHSVQLSDAELAKVLTEFRAGLGWLQSSVTQKMKCWTTLPWKLCGLGHAREEIAREVAQWCTQTFDRCFCMEKVSSAKVWFLN